MVTPADTVDTHGRDQFVDDRMSLSVRRSGHGSGAYGCSLR